MEGNTTPIIWMHCASLGEFEQGRPLFERLLKQYPAYKGLITFFSPSGYEVMKLYSTASYIYYLPFGTNSTSRRFIELVNPRLVVWVKYEFWLYYLKNLFLRNIPIILVSAHFRPDQPFFKWYGGIHREMLGYFTHLFVQNEASRQLLGRIGFEDKSTLNGDTRFDRVVEIAERNELLDVIDVFCQNSRVIVAGSTWLDDEEELEHYANIHPEISFIVAPHEIHSERLREIKALFKKSVLYSDYVQKAVDKKTSIRRECNTLIIDNIGMLSKLYRYATVCYVGGGFGEDGVHNVLEAAVYGKPVVFGPVFNKYTEAIELVEEGGGLSVDTAIELEKLFDRLLSDQEMYLETARAAKRYVYSKKGATDRILTYIQANRLLTN